MRVWPSISFINKIIITPFCRNPHKFWVYTKWTIIIKIIFWSFNKNYSIPWIIECRKWVDTIFICQFLSFFIVNIWFINSSSFFFIPANKCYFFSVWRPNWHSLHRAKISQSYRFTMRKIFNINFIKRSVS